MMKGKEEKDRTLFQNECFEVKTVTTLARKRIRLSKLHHERRHEN